MDIYEVLYTTRAMRRLKPDPVPIEVQARIMDAAIRAPSGGNMQDWRFLLVDDAETRTELGALYRVGWEDLVSSGYLNPGADATEDEIAAKRRVGSSAQHLADHFEDAPLLLFGFSRGGGSSIYPAIWSAMLAARAEGVGSTLTTILAGKKERVLELLGVPDGENWSMAGCVVMGYPRGTWGIAARRPAHEVTFRNRWQQPPGFDATEPLWSDTSK